MNKYYFKDIFDTYRGEYHNFNNYFYISPIVNTDLLVLEDKYHKILYEGELTLKEKSLEELEKDTL